MLRCYVISCAPLRTARKGSQKRSSGVRNPSCVLRPLTPGTRRARRDGEKVAALSKRRCSRVEDSRGTTLRERHSGVEHAAAPFSPQNCACVHPRLSIWVIVRVYVFLCVCVRARARLPPIARLYIRPFPHLREGAATLLLRCLSRAHPPFPSSSSSSSSSFTSSCFSYSSSCSFSPSFPRRPLSSSLLLLRSSFFSLLPVGAEENRGPGPIRMRKSANPVITYGRDN